MKATITVLCLIFSVALSAQSDVEALEMELVKDLMKRDFFNKIELDANAEVARGDLNKDGTEDIAAVFKIVDDLDAQRFLAIGFKSVLGMKLVFGEAVIMCEACGGMMGNPLSDISIANNVLTIDYFGGSADKWAYTYKARYEKGKFRVIGRTENSWRVATETEDLNYNTLEGELSIGQVEDDNSSKKRFKYLIANKRENNSWEGAKFSKIDSRRYVTYGSKNWRGAQDLSFKTATQWDEEHLYLKVQVTDDMVFPIKNLRDILKGDHIEIWLDFGRSMVLDVYDGIIRQKPDANMIQLGVGFYENGNTVAQLLYPERPMEEKSIISKYRKTANGYEMVIKIPMTLIKERTTIGKIQLASSQKKIDYNRDDWETYRQKIGMTIVVSDVDNVRATRQETLIATSQLKWGNPTTFGKCELFDNYEKPLLKELLNY